MSWPQALEAQVHNFEAAIFAHFCELITLSDYTYFPTIYYGNIVCENIMPKTVGKRASAESEA